MTLKATSALLSLSADVCDDMPDCGWCIHSRCVCHNTAI